MNRTDFIAEISHELRTPLMVIRNSLDLLSDSKVHQDNRKFFYILEMAQRNTEYMTEIINYLLDFTKIETGRYVVRRRKIYFNGFIEEIIKEIQSYVEKKKIKIIKNVSENINKINMDPILVKQILVNLLSNALRFASSEIRIEGILINSSRKGESIKVSVCDDGIGIPKVFIEKIFDKFFRVNGSTVNQSYSYNNIGFGLFITKKIVELLGGKIWVESKFRKGSKFIFTIPV